MYHFVFVDQEKRSVCVLVPVAHPSVSVHNIWCVLSGRNTVPFFFFGWGGKVSEFSILGWSQNVINPSVNDPEKPITFKFDIHLVRKAQYYYLKIREFT